MATARSIIDRSARMLGVKATGQSLGAEDDAAFLEGLNAMLVRWEADGLAMGFSAVSAATDTLPVPTETEECVAANLAVRMAPEFGRDPPAVVSAMAVDGYRALLRENIKPKAAVFDLPATGSDSYDIMSDY